MTEPQCETPAELHRAWANVLDMSKAAGVDGEYQHDRSLIPPECVRVNDHYDRYKRSYWNPLADDGDALRQPPAAPLSE